MCIVGLRTFHCQEVWPPANLQYTFCSIANPLSWFDGLCGSGHPDPDFGIGSLQHNQQVCNRSTNRKKAPCHGFHDSNR
jgi:hypothetical protein